MNKIRKPGEHPGKGRIPGVRPISTKEIRNKKRMERLMSDTASFISEKLERIEREYSDSTDISNILRTINKVVIEQATASVSQVNTTEDLKDKVSILHQCVLNIVNTLEKTEQNVNMRMLKHQHEVGLLNSMALELNKIVLPHSDEPFEMPLPAEEDLFIHEEERSVGEEENDTTEETPEEAVE